jgi:hypothetical protein
MVNNQIESHINQMQLLNHLIKLLSLQYFEGIAIDVKSFVSFYLSVARLNE